MICLMELFDWLGGHAAFTTVMLVISLVVLIASVWIVHSFLVSIPPDYFAWEHKPLERWRNLHPVFRWTLLVAKNLVGTLLILAGLVMLITPGQGVLTLLLGITLVDIPGKRALERRKCINRLRSRAGQAPLMNL